MASVPTSGWHAGSIAPSYVGVQNVLGHSAPTTGGTNTGGGGVGGTTTGGGGGGSISSGSTLGQLLQKILGTAGFGGGSPFTGGGGGAAGGAGNDFFGGRYSVGDTLTAGEGTVYDPFIGRSGGGLGGPTGITDQAGNPIYTPEQSYSMYLQQLGGATSRSPQVDMLNQILYNQQQQAYGGHDRYNSPAGYINANPKNRAANAQLNTLQAALPLANPYSYAYGAPAAHAPAPTPPWGYPLGYGSPPSGIGGGGSGRSAPNTGGYM